MPAQKTSAELHVQRLTATLAGGAALIVCACLGVILWVLSVSTTSVDATEINGDHRLLHSVLETYQGNLSRAVTDYASWDELFNDFTRKRNTEWEAENLGPYITTAFDVDFVAVVAPSGSAVYLFARSGRPATDLSLSDAHTLRSLRDAVYRIKPSSTPAVVSGTVTFRGRPSLVSVAPIIPTSPSRFAERSGYSLIEIRALDGALLGRIEKSFGLAGLRVVRTAPHGVSLAAPDKRPSGFLLTWTPYKAGGHLFSRVLPAVLLTGGLLFVAFIALLAFWWKVVEHIRASQARTLKAEIVATRTRAAAAEEMARSKSAFIANMSHELRTPLNAIIGFSEIMDCESMGPIGVAKYKEYIKAIYDSGHHLLRIINDILLISKVEAGKFEPNLEDTRLDEVLQDTVRMVAVIAGRRNITIDTTGAARTAVIGVDRQALSQILLNVMSNAVKFSPDGAAVTVECVEAGGMLEVRVIDRGCGIPPETMRDIGKPFVQAEGAYTRNFQGTGLGLAISFRLAAAMGGSISIDSTVGAGTTVTIRLKLTPALAEVA